MTTMPIISESRVWSFPYWTVGRTALEKIMTTLRRTASAKYMQQTLLKHNFIQFAVWTGKLLDLLQFYLICG